MCSAVANDFLPLSVPVLDGREAEYVNEAVTSGWVSTAGSYVGRFESAIQEFSGAAHVVACVNGTSALHIALLLAGVMPGDEVVTPTLTFIGTVNPIAYCGAVPVFLDCDAHMNLDAAAVARFLATRCERTERGVTDTLTGRRVSAILPVHVFGNPCELAAIMQTAAEWGLPVVEDAAEAIGSSWTAGPLAGRHAGTVGLLGAYSFNGNKIVTSGGGGAILTNDTDLAAQARHLTTTAKTDAVHFIHDEVGYNYRLTNMAAALGVAQMESLPRFIQRKTANFATYRDALAGIPGITFAGVPDGVAPNYWFYSILIDEAAYGRDRESLLAALDAEGIQTRPIWQLNNEQTPYADAPTFEIERAVWFWQRVLNLPCSSNLSEADVLRVAAAIKRLGR